MKNFDIEHLERKNIYKTPDNFFAEMQENVLRQTVRQENTIELAQSEGKIIPLKRNWAYSVAAALAILLGVGFFVRNMNATPENPVVAANSNSEVKNVAEITQNQQPAAETAIAEAAQPTEEFAEDLTFEKKEYQNVTKEEQRTNPDMKAFAKAVPVKKSKKEPVQMRNEEPIDVLLTTFTSAELAEMSESAEMDVYLDLYN